MSKAYQCEGCGHLTSHGPEEDLRRLRERPGTLSCCPERKMRPVKVVGVADYVDVEREVRELRVAQHRYGLTIEAMQGVTFFCQDDEGFLRRWTPPTAYTPVEQCKAVSMLTMRGAK